MTLKYLGRKENRKELDKILDKVFGYETVWIDLPYDNHPRCSCYHYYVAVQRLQPKVLITADILK